MLALILSGAVALASLVFFFSAFFAPKLHRKDDFLWSGFGFFYGLVLWNCAQLFTGAILLGQLVAVILILAFAWQTLRLRAAIAKNAIAEVPSFSLVDWLTGGLKRKPKAPVVVPEKVEKEVTTTEGQEIEEGEIENIENKDKKQQEAPADTVEEVAEILVETAEEVVEELNTAAETVAEKVIDTVEQVAEPVASEKPQASVEQTTSAEISLKKPKSKLFQRLFGGKNKPVPVAEQVVNSPDPGIDDDDEDWGEEAEVSTSENSENREEQVVASSEVAQKVAEVEESTEQIVEAVQEIAEQVQELEDVQAVDGVQEEVEDVAISVEEVNPPAPEELPTPSLEESAPESVESTEESPTPECTENKVPEVYAAYVESEDPAEAIANELEANDNDQNNAPQP